MMRLLRFVQLLTMATWVGGLTFFAFVLAPTAFHVLPSVHEAGLIVGASLKAFDRLALIFGAIFVGSSAVLYFVPVPIRVAPALRRSVLLQFLLALLMMLGTGYLHWSIIPAMDADQRAAGGDIDVLPRNNPVYLHFDRFHHLSEQVAGAVLLMGLIIVFLLSTRHYASSERDAIP